MSGAAGGLEQIEKDIMLCEQFLSTDKFVKAGSSTAPNEVVGHPKTSTLEAANRDSGPLSASTPQAAASAGSTALSAERKKEILDRLLAERAARKEGAASSSAAAAAAAAASTAANTGAGGKRKESREELIQRLVREKRDRDARRAAAAAAGEDRGDDVRREAWGEGNVSRADISHIPGIPGTPDSLLDGSRGRTASPVNRGAVPAKRPLSAPRTRRQAANASSSAAGAGAGAASAGGAGVASRQRPRSASAERRTVFNEFSFHGREVPNKHSKEALSRAEEERRREELTFRPQINNKYVPSKQQGSGGNASAEEKIERLARSRREEWEKREKVRAEAEERAIKESCTFKPKLTKAKLPDGSTPGIPVEVRLINEANSKQSMREKARRHMEEIEFQKTCTFKPQINAASRYLDAEQRPLHERVGEMQRERRMKLHEAKVKEEMGNPDLTFKPSINEKSAKIAEQLSEPVTQRLVANSQASLQRKLTKMAEIAQEREQQNSFRPQPNVNSERILVASDKFAGKTFYERQQEALQKRQVDEASGETEYPFKPRVGANSSLLLAGDRENETEEEKIDRLAYKDKERQDLSREAMQEMYYSQFSFKPHINKVSKQLGHAHTVEELHKDQRRRERMGELVRRANEEQEMECTFRPEIGRRRPTQSMNDLRQPSMDASGERSRYSIDVNDVETLTERIKHHAMRKGAAIDQERRRREYEELKECTFKPQIRPKSARKQPQGPIIVRGLGRHLELKELAQKKEEEKKERERKVFLLDSATSKTSKVSKPYTVPQPFQLSSNDAKHQDRRRALEEEVAAQQMSECTFKPRVNDGRVRKFLDSIMGDNGLDYDIDAEASLLNIR